MNANFFNQIEEINYTGDLHLIISKGADNNFVVSAILQNDQCGDKAKDMIIPYTIRGTAQELDEEFLERIKNPVQITSGLIDNMEAYLKQLETAKSQSAMEKGKADKEKKLSDEKSKKYKDAMTKADELEKEGKHREAWMRLPQISDYPEKADEISKRKTELSEKFSMPSLFETE